MILYHDTGGAFLPSINADGLVPTLLDPDVQMLGKPVVWLTTEHPQPSWMPGRAIPCCIEVRLEPSSARLAYYATRARKRCHDLAEMYLGVLPELGPVWESWYLYFGTVPRGRLVLPA